MQSLAFVTPAYGRYELTAICLEQRKRLIKDLRERGIDATCIVIANDENLDTAKDLGFLTVERNNLFLGRRFNDGFALAAKQGIDLIHPIGSDSWVDATLFEHLPQNTCEITTGLNYAVINPKATYRAELQIIYSLGIGYTFCTELAKEVDYRPCGEFLKRGCDTATHDILQMFGGRRTYWGGHSLQHVGFHSDEEQVTDLENLMNKFECNITFNPWLNMDKHYDTDLIDRMKALHKSRNHPLKRYSSWIKRVKEQYIP